MKTSETDAQYATGLSRQNIEQALIAAGKDPGHLTPADLGALEDFHTLGRIATGRPRTSPAHWHQATSASSRP